MGIVKLKCKGKKTRERRHLQVLYSCSFASGGNSDNSEVSQLLGLCPKFHSKRIVWSGQMEIWFCLCWATRSFSMVKKYSLCCFNRLHTMVNGKKLLYCVVFFLQSNTVVSG